eukprot:scaffold97137_cov40-Tisochrysis_lutea.AAC.1
MVPFEAATCRDCYPAKFRGDPEFHQHLQIPSKTGGKQLVASFRLAFLDCAFKRALGGGEHVSRIEPCIDRASRDVSRRHRQVGGDTDADASRELFLILWT